MPSERILACDDLYPITRDTVHSTRAKLFESVMKFSDTSSQLQDMAINMIGRVKTNFGDVLLPEDERKLEFNYISAGWLINQTIDMIHEGEKLTSYPSGLYTELLGCGVNMIIFADSVVDEQRPSPEFLDELYDACFNCVKDPNKIHDYSFPNEEKYKKAKAALIFAHLTGRALEGLELWANRSGNTEAFVESRDKFIESAEILMEAEKNGYLLRQDP